MTRVDCKRDNSWLDEVLDALERDGFAVVEGVLDPDQAEEFRAAMYRAQELLHDELGAERIDKAGEVGVLRLMMRYDPAFVRLIELPEVLAIADRTVSDTSIMHLQNGFIFPPIPAEQDLEVFQTSFHMDFRRVLNSFVASVNTLFAITEFTEENGGTIVVPGTHQQAEAPSVEYLRANAVPLACPAGSMIVFDSTLWHAGGVNRSGADRCGINQQFTPSYFKQQIDYVRALGNDFVTAQKARTQQLLGWYTRLPTSLEEYYVAPEDRLYRANQG